jgi:hypothetical protein
MKPTHLLISALLFIAGTAQADMLNYQPLLSIKQKTEWVRNHLGAELSQRGYTLQDFVISPSMNPVPLVAVKVWVDLFGAYYNGDSKTNEYEMIYFRAASNEGQFVDGYVGIDSILISGKTIPDNEQETIEGRIAQGTVVDQEKNKAVLLTFYDGMGLLPDTLSVDFSEINLHLDYTRSGVYEIK